MNPIEEIINNNIRQDDVYPGLCTRSKVEPRIIVNNNIWDITHDVLEDQVKEQIKQALKELQKEN